MLIKKEYMYKVIEEGLTGCTVIGSPSENYINLIRSKELQLKATKINFKESNFNNKIIAVSIDNGEPISKDDFDFLVEELFEEVFEYYQCFIGESILNKILNTNEQITFKELLTLIPLSQADLSKRVYVGRQVITDMKSGRQGISIVTLRNLIKEFPLLPYRYFI